MPKDDTPKPITPEELASQQPQDIQNPQEPEEQEVVEDVNERVKPAIEIVKEFLKRAKERQDVRAEAEAHEEQAELESQNAEKVMDLPETIYISVDGDGIGNKVFQAKQSNDEEGMIDVDRRIKAGGHWIGEWTQKYGGRAINIGGDDGLIKISNTAMDHVEELRQQYKDVVNATLSVGVGSTLAESSDALQLAKLRGKDQVVVFDEGTTKELETRMQQEDIDCDRKLKICIQSGNDEESQQANQESPETEEEAVSTKESPESPEASEAKEPTETPEEKPAEETEEAAPSRVEEEPPVEEAEGEVPQAEEEPEEPQAEAPTSGLPSQLLEAMGPPKMKKKALASYSKDSEIEKKDFSTADDPEFAKRIHYAVKYGPR